MAQLGSALEWGSRGRKFNSSHSDQKEQYLYIRLLFFFLNYEINKFSFFQLIEIQKICYNI